MSNREDLVIDASALVALLIDGGRRGTWVAERVENARLHAPDHLMIETINVLRRQRNAGLLTPSQAHESFASLGDFPITLWPWHSTAEGTWQLGASLSNYDAAYVALAQRIDAPLITLDTRLARAPGGSGRVETPDR